VSEEASAHVYMLKCADGSYYVGSARRGLDRRVSEHNSGSFGGYTSKRLRALSEHHRCHCCRTANKGLVTCQERSTDQGRLWGASVFGEEAHI